MNQQANKQIIEAEKDNALKLSPLVVRNCVSHYESIRKKSTFTADIVNYINDFDSIIAIIEKSKMRAIRAVNREMIDVYWRECHYSAGNNHR